MRISNITYFCDFVIKPGVDLPFMLGSEKVTPLFWTWEDPGVKAGTSCLSTINLKVLLDTGSTKSFIRPEIADKYFKNAIKKDPFQISTVHGSSVENFSTTIPSIEMFNTKRNDMLKFYLFDFHKYFDCLLGVDNLKLIKAFIDLNKEVLILPDSNAKIYFHKTLPSSNFILVEPRTEQIITRSNELT
nr:unnamed protein product [Callosobruchus chinensis]